MTAAGKNAYPEVLDELLKDMKTETVVEVGLVEIPMDQVVGTRSAGRTKAFTAGFRPLLPIDTEFAAKWINLCAAHLSEGIREPVLCYEYLGRFYLQEGPKRFSVLKHMGSPRITGQVLRVMPVNDGSPRYQAYKEFLEFYKSTGIYEVQFRRPGDYAELMTHLEKEPGIVWTERERRNFSAYFYYFRDAYFSHGEELDLLPEDIRRSLKKTEEVLSEFSASGRTIYIAIAYGSRNEIVDAVNRAIRRGEPVSEQSFLEELALPLEMDLVIRTGGEQRLSNFFLYQLAYGELYFSDRYFPDFSEEDLQEAFGWYASRKRRYGLVL